MSLLPGKLHVIGGNDCVREGLGTGGVMIPGMGLFTSGGCCLPIVTEARPACVLAYVTSYIHICLGKPEI